MKRSSWILFSCGAALACVAAAAPAQAGLVFYNETFESRTLGNLSGQDGWITPGTDNSWVVTAGTGVGGSQSAEASSAASVTFRDLRTFTGTINAGDHIILESRVRAGQHETVAVGFTKVASPANDILWLRIYNNGFGPGFTGYQMEFYRSGVNQSTQGTLTSTHAVLAETGFHTFLIDWLVGTNITFSIKNASNATMLSGTTPDTIPSGDRANWAAAQLYFTSDGLATASADIDNLFTPEPTSAGLLAVSAIACLGRRRRV